MSDNRRGEPPERHFRSDRVVMARGRWYVVTRECIDIGPYDTREAAQTAAEQLGQALHAIDDDPAVALALIGEFMRPRNAVAGDRRHQG